MEFLNNYGSTIIVAIIIIAILFLAVRKIFKNKKDGKGTCSCGCEGCAYKDNCHK